MSESKTKDSEADEAEGGEGADRAEARPRSRKALVLAVVAALLLLGGGGGAAWFFFLSEPSDAVAAEAVEGPTTFVDVPPIQVMLRGSDGRSRALRVHVMLVPGSKPPEEITTRLPQVLDRFQPFLRELRPEDMAGSAATFRVKEELLIRANQALGDGAVRDVLIQDLMQA